MSGEKTSVDFAFLFFYTVCFFEGATLWDSHGNTEVKHVLTLRSAVKLSHVMDEESSRPFESATQSLCEQPLLVGKRQNQDDRGNIFQGD